MESLPTKDHAGAAVNRIFRLGAHQAFQDNAHRAIQDAIDTAVTERTAALAAELERLRPIVDAALAWEQTRQSIWQPGQFVETHPKEMSDRMHAHTQREKELRALVAGG